MTRRIEHALEGAGRLLRRLIAEVESGRLPARGSRDVALVRRIEGAATALEVAAHDRAERAGGER